MMGFGIFGFLFIVIVLGAIVAVAGGLSRGFRPGMTGQTNISTSATIGAREILDQRYAKGEITEEEYRNMKKDINE